jgi:hypothetical protein
MLNLLESQPQDNQTKTPEMGLLIKEIFDCRCLIPCAQLSADHRPQASSSFTRTRSLQARRVRSIGHVWRLRPLNHRLMQLLQNVWPHGVWRGLMHSSKQTPHVNWSPCSSSSVSSSTGKTSVHCKTVRSTGHRLFDKCPNQEEMHSRQNV